MQLYRGAFGEVLAGIKEFDEDKVLAGNDKLNEGITALDDYNTALETLAEEVGAEIKY